MRGLRCSFTLCDGGQIPMRSAGVAIVLVACMWVNGCGDASSPTRPPAGTDKAPASAAPPPGISAEESQQLPPLPPAGVRLVLTEGRVSVHWHGTKSPVAHYEVYRQTRGTPTWQLVGTVPATADDTGEYSWLDDQSPRAGATYGVAAVSAGGVRSVITTP